MCFLKSYLVLPYLGLGCPGSKARNHSLGDRRKWRTGEGEEKGGKAIELDQSLILRALRVIFQRLWKSPDRKKEASILSLVTGQGLTVNSQHFTCLVQRQFPLAPSHKHSEQPRGPEARSQQSRATRDAPPPNLAKASVELATAAGRGELASYHDCAMVSKGCALMPLGK